MSRNQRLVLLAVAAVIAVVAIVAIPRGDDDETTTVAQTAMQTTVAGTTSPSTVTEAPPEPTPSLLQAGSVKELEHKKGDTVRFRVRSPEAEEVHVHGYDISKDIKPNKTATTSFKATIEGIFEIELKHSGTEIASLKVEPR